MRYVDIPPKERDRLANVIQCYLRALQKYRDARDRGLPIGVVGRRGAQATRLACLLIHYKILEVTMQ